MTYSLRMHRRILAAIGTAAVALGLSAAPSVAAPAAGPDETWYLALGDSYGAGYQPGAGDDLTGGYAGPVLDAFDDLAPGAQLENLSCSGETVGSLLDGGTHCAYAGSQIDAAEAFLADHPGTRLITLDIGGNDVQTCVGRTGSIDFACLQEGMSTIRTRLPEIISRLQAAAPDAQIVLTNYPDVFLAAWLTGESGQEIAKLSVNLVENLNSIYEDAATTAGIDFADVADAFSTTDFTTVDDSTYGTIPVNVSRVCSLTWMCTRTDIHPNDEGYAVIASVIAALLEDPAAPTTTTTTTSSTSTTSSTTTGTATTTTARSSTSTPAPTSTSTDGGPQTPAVVQTDDGTPFDPTALLLVTGAGALTAAAGLRRRRSTARH